MLTLHRVFGFKKGLSANPAKTLEKFGLPADRELLPALTALDETVFLKTHRPANPGDTAPAIYLVRDGRDSVVSLAHYRRGRGHSAIKDLDFDAVLERIITRRTANGTWSENVRSWTDRPGRTAVVRFERLIDDPAAALGGAVDVLGLEVPKPRVELPSFEELRARDPVMFRRGKAGTWRTEMSPELEELFWEL